MKKYPIINKNGSGWTVNEEVIPLIYNTRQGLSFDFFNEILEYLPIKFAEWSKFLHLSERSMQRYKKEKKHFDSIYAEKILEIALLYQSGEEVFGNKTSFDKWMNIHNTTMGGSKPKEFLDNTFGIKLIKDELVRIEQGIVS